MAPYMIGSKQSQASSHLPSPSQKQRAQRASSHAVSVSSKGEWKGNGSRELAAKKTEMLPVGILSIESIDEGPVIEEIEIGTVSPEGGEEYREPGVVLYEIETLDKQDFPAGQPETEVMGLEPAATPGIETIEIEDVEIQPVPAAPPVKETTGPEPAPVKEPEKVSTVLPEIEEIEILPTPAAPVEMEIIEVETVQIPEEEIEEVLEEFLAAPMEV